MKALNEERKQRWMMKQKAPPPKIIGTKVARMSSQAKSSPTYRHATLRYQTSDTYIKTHQPKQKKYPPVFCHSTIILLLHNICSNAHFSLTINEN